jgi:uncharacterized protein (DUF924 family)
VSSPGLPRAEDVVAFWTEAGESKWYKKDETFDREIATRFADLHTAAAAEQLSDWEGDATGTLALLLLLDQFSRNLFRGSPRAFAQDAMAHRIAQSALDRGFDQKIAPPLRQFFYLPFMHSEDIGDQERCVALCHSLPGQSNLAYAREHEVIIRNFGRFPHRNAVLGRHTSPAEQAFLDSGGFAG